MPYISIAQTERKSDRSSTASERRSKRLKKTDVEDQRIKDTEQAYQQIDVEDQRIKDTDQTYHQIDVEDQRIKDTDQTYHQIDVEDQRINDTDQTYHQIDVEDQRIKDTDQTYQQVNTCVLQEATEGLREENNHVTHYQPMNVAGHYLTMVSHDTDLYVPMAESSVKEDGGEYTQMGGATNRVNNVYVNDTLGGKLYDNESVGQKAAGYINSSGKGPGIVTEVTSAMEDGVYEKIYN
jgi:hypothetical protein